MSLEAQKEQFLTVLHQVTREVVHSEDLGVAITPASIDDAVQRLETAQAHVQAERQQLLANLHQATPAARTGAVAELSESLVRVRAERECNAEAMRKTEARLKEVFSYRKLLRNESARLERAYERRSPRRPQGYSLPRL